jgi:hypothetical protein
MAQVLRNTRQESAQTIVDAIFGDLDRFAGEAPSKDHSDDQTLAILKVT